MATSKSLSISSLAKEAGKKGLSLVSTGDITHEGWLSEISNMLKRSENGFYIDKETGMNFLLTGEISHIYKDKGMTRKVHSIIVSPGLEEIKILRQKLLSHGVNLHSDGRPIMKVTPKELLGMMLDISEDMLLIPAHIWTPWFSLFGSKSGYDVIEDCFEDLTPHICALETGLSSDIPMNRRVSALDRYTLLSNSDAHSAGKLGRNATVFDGEFSYHGLMDAIKGGKEVSTVDTFPQTGKYHLDGHRKCDVVLQPGESHRLNNICPVCGKPLTLGVLHRVFELSDREEPLCREDYKYIVPLKDILSDITGYGINTKRVGALYDFIIEKVAPELPLLVEMETNEIQERILKSEFSKQLLSLPIKLDSLRKGHLDINPGFDGTYGSIKFR